MTKVEPKKYFDYGQKATDLELNRLEERLRKEYQRASKEVTEKMNEHLNVFAKKDEAKRLLVDSGKLAKDDYIKWRQGQLYTAGRWSELSASLTQDYVNTNKITASMITNHNYDVFALNYNYSAFEVDNTIKTSTSWTLYDRYTVEQLAKGNKDLPLKTKMNIPKDMKWNKRQIESAMMQGILQGESIPNIAKRLPRAVGEKNLNGAIRRARTLTTFAQNSGRLEAYKEAAEESGLKMQKCWIATLDARTRDSHATLNGECVNLNKKFSNGLNCPGDENGNASEIYNCRCTIITQIEGLEHDLSYIDEYKLEQQEKEFKEWQDLRNTFSSDTIDAINRLRDGQQVSEKTISNIINKKVKRTDIISGLLNVDDEQARDYALVVKQWSSISFSDIRAYQQGKSATNRAKSASDLLEEFINKHPKWTDGITHRGVSLTNSQIDELTSLMKNNGIWDARGTSSWTTDMLTAKEYAKRGKLEPVIFSCQQQSRGIPLNAYAAFLDSEEEVLVSKRAKYKIVSIKKEEGIWRVILNELED